jgi:hypothetical protein
MDNTNLREDQRKAIREALLLAAAAQLFAEMGRAKDARESIVQVIERLTQLASGPQS